MDLDAAVLGFFWVLSVVTRMQNHGEQGIVFVLSQFGTSFLDFNLIGVTEVGRLVKRLLPVTKHDFYICIPNKSMAVIANAALGYWNRSADLGTITVTDRRELVLSILEDPTNYPEMFLEGGRPFEMAFEQMGNWRDLVYRRQGFASMTFGDLHSPCPEKLAPIREKALREETEARVAAFSGAQPSSNETHTPCSSEDGEDSASENPNEFLM